LESKRRAATSDLISFTEYSFPSYAPAALHRQIAEQLQRVERCQVDRLMLLVPPRHGKSELASRRFPAWYLGRHPDKQFISASASVTLAEDFGRDVRNLVASPSTPKFSIRGFPRTVRPRADGRPRRAAAISRPESAVRSWAAVRISH
jgi:hypothetical protein